MNVFHRFTRESLIRNRSRTLVTIVGIILSVALLTAVTEGAYIGITLEPDAIHIMKKSEYSGLYGDYSSFSNELDELSEAPEEDDE